MLDDHDKTQGQIVHEALEEACKDTDSTEEAVENLLIAARANRDLMDAIVEPRLESLAYTLIRQHRHKQRTTAWRKSAVSPRQQNQQREGDPYAN